MRRSRGLRCRWMHKEKMAAGRLRVNALRSRYAQVRSGPPRGSPVRVLSLAQAAAARRLLEDPPREEDEEGRKCQACGARLRPSNRRGTCRACQRAHVGSRLCASGCGRHVDVRATRRLCCLGLLLCLGVGSSYRQVECRARELMAPWFEPLPLQFRLRPENHLVSSRFEG